MVVFRMQGKYMGATTTNRKTINLNTTQCLYSSCTLIESSNKIFKIAAFLKPLLEAMPSDLEKNLSENYEKFLGKSVSNRRIDWGP